MNTNLHTHRRAALLFVAGLALTACGYAAPWQEWVRVKEIQNGTYDDFPFAEPTPPRFAYQRADGTVRWLDVPKAYRTGHRDAECMFGPDQELLLNSGYEVLQVGRDAR